jgi:hypothetical protein
MNKRPHGNESPVCTAHRGDSLPVRYLPPSRRGLFSMRRWSRVQAAFNSRAPPAVSHPVPSSDDEAMSVTASLAHRRLTVVGRSAAGQPRTFRVERLAQRRFALNVAYRRLATAVLAPLDVHASSRCSRRAFRSPVPVPRDQWVHARVAARFVAFRPEDQMSTAL